MNQYVSAAISGLITGGAWAALAAAAGEPWCGLYGVEIFAAAGTVAFCQWWLYNRLICLGGDQAAIGMLVSIEPATGKSGLGAFDTDYSINLLLYDDPPGITQADAEVRPPFGELIKAQQAITDLGLLTPGETATDVATGIKSAILHAEFEGAGIRDLMIGAQVALGLSIAALIACVAIPGPIGWVVSALLALLAFLAALFGALFGLGDTGSPADVDPGLGNLHTNDPANNNLGADLLYVMGTWVYDSFHDGWNELHPIKACSRVGRWDGDWPDDFDDTIVRIKAGFDDARDPQTQGEQKHPRHHWHHHPDVDGCKDKDEPPPIE
ncbi:MAG: hypothetical protein WBW88_11445 [Rhodothermales bacterium]